MKSLAYPHSLAKLYLGRFLPTPPGIQLHILDKIHYAPTRDHKFLDAHKDAKSQRIRRNFILSIILYFCEMTQRVGITTADHSGSSPRSNSCTKEKHHWTLNTKSFPLTELQIMKRRLRVEFVGELSSPSPTVVTHGRIVNSFDTVVIGHKK